LRHFNFNRNPGIFFLLLIELLCSYNCLSQVYNYKNCRTNINLNVVIDTFYQKTDTVRNREANSPVFIDNVGNCMPCYQLKTSSSKLKIIGFVVVIDMDEDIVEVTQEGSMISGQALRTIRQAQKGRTVYFECIKAKHENGNIFILNPFSIIL
jgi:hypothetical protein